MVLETVRTTAQEQRTSERRSQRLQLFLAFFAIYIIWGSTYLAIRVAVQTVPPLFAAGVRFTAAGAVLYAWARFRGTPAPTRLEWRSLSLQGVLMFLFAYGGLFWAEKSIPSGIASLLVATIPVWTVLFEVFVFRQERLRPAVIGAIFLGLAGVIVLTFKWHGGPGLKLWPCLAILGAEISWSLGTVLSKSLRLPSSKPLTSGGEMLAGGLMLLFFSLVSGEMHPWPQISLQAAGAILYLIVAGSLIAFTAYVWLLGRLPASTVSSYAYVNPVVALAIGYWMGGEALGPRTALGAGLVLASVLLILKRKGSSPTHN